MNSALTLTFILASCVTVIFGQIDCTGKPDGAYGTGCRSYTLCKGGKGTIVDCQPDEAYNHRTGKCEPIETVPSPCGSLDHGCDKRGDGKYAILPNCTYFYTCFNHLYFGANPCNNPPDGNTLVFNEEKQYCDWRFNVPPPCGTA